MWGRIALVAALAACSSPPSPRVHDGFLHDELGRARILRGVNLSGAQKNAPYLDDKTPADYARLRAAWGFNAIRFLMTWAAVEPSPGVFDDAYLDRVAERMGWAADAGLAVIVEMHQDIYGEGFGFDGAPRWTCDEARYTAFVPKTPWFLNASDPNVIACVDDFYTRDDLREHFVAAWRRVAERLAGAPAVIGFDVLNEPAWGSSAVSTFEQDRLAPLYARVVGEVRAVAPHWVAFLEPSASRNVGFTTRLSRFEFSDVMYAPHSYDSSAEGGAGFDPTHRQRILDDVSELAHEAAAMNAGLWIGEYGGDPAAPGIVDYMTAEYDAAGAVAASSMYWAYDKGDGYSLLDADGNEKPLLLGVLVRPYPELVAGTPVRYAFEAATSTFTFVYRPDRAIGVPTQIAVPARVYPQGYTVECDGCTYERGDGILAVMSPPVSAEATVVLRP